MYLSRVEVDSRNRQKIKDLTHLGAYHNWVEQCFPEELKRKERRRHLWRLDTLRCKQYLLILSEEKPDIKKLIAYGVSGTAMIKTYDSFLDKIQAGQIMQFRLTANPSRKISRPGKKQGRVVPHITVDQQRNWLIDRAAASGFELVQQEVVDEPETPVSRAFDIVARDWPVLHHKQERSVRLSRVTFEGLLRVTDVETFKTTLTQGLGREKAFGMGLMTVIPER